MRPGLRAIHSLSLQRRWFLRCLNSVWVRLAILVVLRHLLCRAGFPESFTGFHVAHYCDQSCTLVHLTPAPWYLSAHLCILDCMQFPLCLCGFMRRWFRCLGRESLRDSTGAWCKVPCSQDAQAITLAGACACRCATTGASVQTVRHSLDVAAHGFGGIFLGPCAQAHGWDILVMGYGPPPSLPSSSPLPRCTHTTTTNCFHSRVAFACCLLRNASCWPYG